MKLVPIFDFELRYTSLEPLDFGGEGRFYGSLEGSVTGEKVRGTMRLTNLARRRADNVNLPELRGVLDTEDGARAYVELDGIANLREADQARVFVTSGTFRTGDERYRRLNHTLAVLEGVLDSVSVGGTARGRAYRCEATIE